MKNKPKDVVKPVLNITKKDVKKEKAEKRKALAKNSLCFDFNKELHETIKSYFLESIVSKEVTTETSNMQWSLETFKQHLVKENWSASFAVLNKFIASTLTNSKNGQGDTTAKDTLLKIARLLVDAVEKVSEKDCDEIVAACNLTCCSLVYFNQHCVDVDSHTNIIKMHFHILKQFYKKLNVQGASVILISLVMEYVLCKQNHVQCNNDTEKIITTCQKIAYAMYSKNFSGMISEKLNDMTDVFSLRSNELILLLCFDLTKYHEIISAFTLRWTKVIIQGNKLKVEIIIHNLQYLMGNICRHVTENPNTLIHSEKILWKLLQLFILLSLSIQQKNIFLDWLIDYSRSVKELSSFCSLILTVKCLYPLLLLMKFKRNECIGTVDQLDTFLTSVDKISSNTIGCEYILDLLVTIKTNYHRPNCLSSLSVLLEMFECFYTLLLEKNILQTCQVELISTKMTSLIQITGWILKVVYTFENNNENGCKCNNNRSRMSTVLNKFFDKLELLCKIFRQSEFAPTVEEVKWLLSVLHKLSACYYTNKLYVTSKRGFLIVKDLSQVLLDILDGEMVLESLKEVVSKYDALICCFSKLDCTESIYETYIHLIKLIKQSLFQHKEIISYADVADLVQSRIQHFVKIKIKLYFEGKEDISTSKSLFEHICGSDCVSDDNELWLDILSTEYEALLKYSDKYDISNTLKQLLEFQTLIHEDEGNLLQYSLLLLKMSTLQGQTYKERLHWCKEAINVLEEMYNEMEGTGDELEWHVKDLIGCAYFQLCIVQYEEKVASSTQLCNVGVQELIHEVSIANHLSDTALDDYLDETYICSLNTAMEHWMELCNEATKLGNCSVFYDAEHSAKFMYEASIMYSLMCQNFSAVKCAYSSGILYNSLSKKDGASNAFNEQAVTSFMHAASQMLLVENKQATEKILSYLKNLSIDSPIQLVQIDLIDAAYLIAIGEVDKSREILQNCLLNELLQNQTRTSLTVKSEIYLQLSYLRLIPSIGKELESTDIHFPMQSPFPPMVDCLKFLRSLYSVAIDSKLYDGSDNAAHNKEIYFSSSLNILNRLLSCIAHYASILKQQGTVMEAKSLLKEGLLLARKFHLPFRMMEIIQQISSIDLMLHNKEAFHDNFKTMTSILKSVDGCFDENTIYIPEFVNHRKNCCCFYCAHPRLQQIHICLFLQFIESKKQFDDGAFESNMNMQVIDALIDNANVRYLTAQMDVHDHVERLHVFTFNQSDEQQCQTIQRKVKTRKKTKKVTNKNQITFLKNESVTLFSKYHVEAKIIEPIGKQKSNHVIKTVEHLIKKIETASTIENIQHDYQRLIAQLYCLRSMLYVGENISSSWGPQPDVRSNLSKDEIQRLSEEEEENKMAVVDKKKRTRRKKEDDVEPVKTSRRTCKKRLNKELTTTTTKRLTSNKKDECTTALVSGCGFDTFTKDLQKALSVLNPYTDTLIIKTIYELITFIAGASNKKLSVACQVLLSARTLHQQLLSSYGKRRRKQLDLVSNCKQIDILQSTAEIIETYSTPEFVFSPTDGIQALVDEHVPRGWRICSLSMNEMNDQAVLIITRLQSHSKPQLVRININEEHDEVVCGNICNLATMFEENISQKFDDLMQENKDSMSITIKKEWWNERKRLDHQLQSYIKRIEENWLQGWRALLLGEPLNDDVQLQLDNVAKTIYDQVYKSCEIEIDIDLLKVILDGYYLISEKQMLICLKSMVSEKYINQLKKVITTAVEKSNLQCLLHECERNPVILIMDKKLQKLPWESIPCLRRHSVTRMPSLLMTVTHCINNKEIIKNQLKVEDTFYVVNPRNDLKLTEDKFVDWFNSEGWSGVAGRPPSQTEYMDALTKNDLFIYCGHGSGQEYLGWDSVQQLNCKAVSILMGCSSGKLKTQGEIEAHGMSQYYLLAGSPAVVANLWDVTDKDIDTFLEDLLKRWLTQTKGSDLGVCVSKARETCKLTYLIGAAPVIYGLPIALKLKPCVPNKLDLLSVALSLHVLLKSEIKKHSRLKLNKDYLQN